MLGVFRRRPRLPSARRPPLDRDERVLAWSDTAGDGDAVVLATNRGLWLPGLNRLGWHEIHKAVWSGRELRVTPAQICAQRDGYAVVADQPEVCNLLLEPGELPHQVRSRVTRSVSYTAHHRLPSGGVRVVARRVSGVDGLSWQVRYDPGTPADDPEVLALTEALVEQARAATVTDPEA